MMRPPQSGRGHIRFAGIAGIAVRAGDVGVGSRVWVRVRLDRGRVRMPLLSGPGREKGGASARKRPPSD